MVDKLPKSGRNVLDILERKIFVLLLILMGFQWDFILVLKLSDALNDFIKILNRYLLLLLIASIVTLIVKQDGFVLLHKILYVRKWNNVLLLISQAWTNVRTNFQ